MSYNYDSSSDEIEKDGTVVGWATTTAIATILIALLSGILSSDPDLLTTFSSIPAPPSEITYWDKNVYRNEAQVSEWWSSSTAITVGTKIEIADRITTTAPFTLTEAWDSSVFDLGGYITETGGIVITSTDALTWLVTSPVVTTTQYDLIKAWTVLTSSFTSTTITETIAAASGTQSTTISFAPGAVPTATPTPTSTPQPTYTPAYTPRPWEETPFPTATPCVGIECGGTDDPTYKLYFPLITKDYGE